MADFCKECSEKFFGEDFRDLAYIVSEEQYLRGNAAKVLCEGCGPIIVDHTGKKVRELNNG
tara:strand:- start:648 stop:830 length:183 start_codon:yes stop_codon:yes gene_type:complete